MFLKKINSMRRTLAFRLTLWYTMIFIASSFGAFAVFYLTVSSVILRNMDEHLQEEIEEYNSLFTLKAGKRIEDELNVEAGSEGIEKVFLRIVDPMGTEIFSTNMSSWKGVGTSRYALNQLKNGADHVFETLSIPGRPHEVRIIYGHLSPNRILQIGISYEDDIKFLELLREIFGIVMGPLILFSALAGLFMARRALTGVEQVTETALDISGGAFDRRVNVRTGGYEIERLATVFNIMLNRINALIKSLREVTDNIAHDLKTPITRIRGMAEIHLGRSESDDVSRNFAADTMEECDNLLLMINTMLDISETEAGATKLEKKKIDITGLIQDAVDLFLPSAAEKGINILSEMPDKTVVYGDLQSLQRMFVNLLENAVKYTSSGGTVSVSVNNNEKDRIVIEIHDTGRGISKEDLPHIFKRLYRCDTSRSHPGFGLGLSLAIAIARAHGGDITASSTPGKGSIFTVALPG